MNTKDTLKDGDFASYLEARQKVSATVSREQGAGSDEDAGDTAVPPRQTIQQVLLDGEEPTDEFLDELHAIENAPDLSDEELERQALDAGN